MKQQAVLLPTQKKKPCTNRNKKWEKDVAFWLWIVLMMQMKPCRPKRTLQAWPLQLFVAKTFTKLKSSFRMIMRPITRKFEWVCGTGGTLGSLNMWCLSQLFSLVDSIRKSYLISMELCPKRALAKPTAMSFQIKESIDFRAQTGKNVWMLILEESVEEKCEW